MWVRQDVNDSAPPDPCETALDRCTGEECTIPAGTLRDNESYDVTMSVTDPTRGSLFASSTGQTVSAWLLH